jgi:hypothetical protein
MTGFFPSPFRPALVAVLLAGGALGAEEPAAKEPAKASVSFVEAFQKGPVVIKAQVARKEGASETLLPLFQTPWVKFGDRLEVAFSGEAFDPRVTPADWSFVVVFLPRTVAPTDKGVVDFRLKKKGGEMVVPSIAVPYDSIPMLFLLPDRNGRKKVLADLTAHLAEFRNLCAKIQALSEERAAADKFLQDLDAIDKNLTGPTYDNAVQSFLHNYGDAVSGDLQVFLSGRSSNLEKAQFLTSEFRKTNVLVPDAAAGTPATAQVTVGAGGGRAVSAYVSIFFDLAMVIHNLWPGHQFQYLPALARGFSGASAELWYSDWIRTTGDVRGALMCCPGRWSDVATPSFSFHIGKGESLLRKEALLEVEPAGKELPFGLFGHDWKLVLTGSKGESLQPIHLEPSPGRKAFVASSGAVREALRGLKTAVLKGRIVGQWGFTSVATPSEDLYVGPDPAWAPAPEEVAAFKAGGDPVLTLPAPWADGVEKVQFRPAKGGKVLEGSLTDAGSHGRRAVFHAGAAEAGKGTLDVFLWGDKTPSLSRPMDMLPDPPVISTVEARPGDSVVKVAGRRLDALMSLKIGDREFDRGETGADGAIVFNAKDGKALEGKAGEAVKVAGTFRAGAPTVPFPRVRLRPVRPGLATVQVHAIEVKTPKLRLEASVPVAPSTGPSQINLITGKGYHFPSDHAFRLAFRNADEPEVVREVPGSKVQVLGNNQKASLALTPSDLLGGRASGRLEVQVQDEHAGCGAWIPLPVTFLDLPVLGTLEGTQLTGPALDAIQAVAVSPAGPWSALDVSLVDGRETAAVPVVTAEGTYYFKLFGWPDLTFTLKVPPPPAAPAPVQARQEAAPAAGPAKDPATEPAKTAQ